MEGAGITILGLGPGDPKLLTCEAWDVLQNIELIYLRTEQHPIVSHLPSGIQVKSFDSIYESGDSFENVYNHIVDHILELGTQPSGIVYAVPGHPYVAEATCPEIIRRALKSEISVRVVEGLSFLEPTFTALGIDPFPQVSLVDAFELATAHIPSFPPDIPALIAQMHSRRMASDVKLTLMANYPDDHPIKLVHFAGTPDVQVEIQSLYELDRNDNMGNFTVLFVPPLGPATSFEAFQEIVAHLRAPDGCPWDKKQTHQSLRPHLLEETYEVLTALDADDPQAMREEFGDLLLQIVLHAQIACEFGEFSMADILQSIHWKIVNRHPHVFGNVDVEDIDGVLRNWERLKAEERTANGKTEESILNGVASTLPALIQAQEYQLRTSRVGFDWPNIQGVVDKFNEEVGEMIDAPDSQAREVEIGDLLFSVVNLSRWYEIDAESALRRANKRFRERFESIEREAKQLNRELSDMALDEMEALWQAAKK